MFVLGAGDCLVDLTSRDGDWFLDDMYLTTGSVTKLISILNPPIDTRLQLALECVIMAHNQYKGLQVCYYCSMMVKFLDCV